MPNLPATDSPVRRVALVGTGLIGGSLGLALAARAPGVETVGADPDADALAGALQRGAVSRTADSPEAAVAGADLVVLSAPVAALPDLLARIGPHLAPGATVTDTGSVKRTVAEAARALPDGVAFTGGHPMAGAERGGIAQADALLFENAAYVLTPDPRTGRVSPTARWLAETVGGRVVEMEAARHDAVAAAVSHLPQLVAVALVEHARDTGDDALALAAGGFRDLTRIASSPFGVWRSIFDANADAVADALGGLLDRLMGYRNALATSKQLRGDVSRTANRPPRGAVREADWGGAASEVSRTPSDPALRAGPPPRGEGLSPCPLTASDVLEAAFASARETRDALPAHARGFLAPTHDVLAWAEDRPGVLHALTGALLAAGLNVSDVELVRVREGDGGAFRLGFRSGADADAAVEVLGRASFRTRRR